MSEKRKLAIRVILLPKDTNALGTIFGGVILSQIDLAATVTTRRYTRQRVVTVAMKEVVFHQPVFVGDVVSFYTSLIRIGNTSISVRVEVEAERATGKAEVVQVTEAEVVYVTVDNDGHKTPLIRIPNKD
ncbi:MAG TPA: acyl-CoA thioesterase [Myxococcales bacterium]|nr:acyl-CoA thioesterase [Myxococcales bacterium]HIN85854.1 acyl-CoA thioesterase [Myxococcales bacterium]